MEFLIQPYKFQCRWSVAAELTGPGSAALPMVKLAFEFLVLTVARPGEVHGAEWAAEETNHPREVVEAVLAHVIQNKGEAVYARYDLFERRRVLMEDWRVSWPMKRRRGVRRMRDDGRRIIQRQEGANRSASAPS